MDADEIIEHLQLEPHPEGGRYRETWRAPAEENERAAGSAIYFLLRSGEVSHWHRVDAAEAWHYYEGAPLELRISTDSATVQVVALGPDLAARQQPQFVVPAGAWQSARSLGDHTLVGCTVSPAFQFEGFELAAPDWSPASGI
ncbi:MAG TPA: cupin domain-containing protein [Acidimicrobiales bacterium]|nr:cupin domain-containing protein [Acidimicrobiales bacterium]